jgi:hypothetical protein
MKQIQSKLIIVLLLLSPLFLLAQQDITGVWSGELVFKDSSGFVHLPYEILVSENKGKYTGYSRITFTVKDKKEYGMQDVAIKIKGKEIEITDEGFIEHDFSINPSDRVKKTMDLLLETNDTLMVLKGNWSTNRTKRYISMSGTAYLQRKADYKATAIYKRLDTLQKTAALNITPPQPMVAVVEPKKAPIPIAVEEVVPDLNIPAIDIAVVNTVPIKAQKPINIIKSTAPTAIKKRQLAQLSKMTIKLPPPSTPTPPVVAIKQPTTKPAMDEPEPIQKPAPTKNKPVAPSPTVAKPVETTIVKAPITPPSPVTPPVAIVAPSVTKGAVDVDKRTNKLEESVYFENDSLILALYDNGEIDGDTVTVIMNGNIVFSKQGLGIKANSKTVYIPSNVDSVNLVMYAESLGEIPPNTGLLVVKDGNKTYDVHFSADLKSNAAILLKRRKDR